MHADLALAGRHAVVTGASRGIGAAIATKFARLGAPTTLMGRDREALEREAARSADTRAIICDVTDPAQVESAFEEACYVDTDLVHNAVKAIVAKTGHQGDKVIGEMVRHNPQGRLIQPEEVADTVAWLCGPDAISVDGQAIAISGGEAT